LEGIDLAAAQVEALVRADSDLGVLVAAEVEALQDRARRGAGLRVEVPLRTGHPVGLDDVQLRHRIPPVHVRREDGRNRVVLVVDLADTAELVQVVLKLALLALRDDHVHVVDTTDLATVDLAILQSDCRGQDALGGQLLVRERLGTVQQLHGGEVLARLLQRVEQLGVHRVDRHREHLVRHAVEFAEQIVDDRLEGEVEAEASLAELGVEALLVALDRDDRERRALGDDRGGAVLIEGCALKVAVPLRRGGGDDRTEDDGVEVLHRALTCETIDLVLQLVGELRNHVDVHQVGDGEAQAGGGEQLLQATHREAAAASLLDQLARAPNLRLGDARLDAKLTVQVERVLVLLEQLRDVLHAQAPIWTGRVPAALG